MIVSTLVILFAQTSASKQETPPFSRHPGLALPVATSAQINAESARALAFARATAIDRNGSPVLRAIGDGTPRRYAEMDDDGGRAYLIGGNLHVWINPTTGLVVSCMGGTDHSMDRPGRQVKDRHGRPGSFMVPRVVTDEEVKELAARYYAATGRAYKLLVRRITDGAGGNGDNIAVDFLPTYRGVPFSSRWSGHIEIDRETGQLDVLSLSGEPPAPPADLSPGVSVEAAYLTALRAAAEAGAPVSEFPERHLAPFIALLDRRPRPTSSYSLTPADHEDAVKGRSRLVYDVRLFDPRYGSDSIYVVLVDAHDGHLLQVGHETFSRQSAPKGPKPSISSFAPPETTRPWRVSEGGGAWSAPAFTTLAPAPADGFAPTRKILLTDGKVAFQAGYDPATGRIALDGPDGKPQVYQPGPALAGLLKRRAKD